MVSDNPAAAQLFKGLDADEVERWAIGFGRVLLTTAELVAREDDDEEDLDVTRHRDAGMLKLHLTAIAAGIVPDHTDDEQDEELLEQCIAFLRAEVANQRAAL